ncbi:uncharacterized protein LOC129776188 [Toxorhynchites rutilus septentrionalis]|uniref:uncharacterized protein LOC129776188 n=1 Tax=Toxorhynchites rutilus septentrionalis TaxID=329112 RepID=UPI0024789420|nr:uncharacterized protein LOC129776188 [Toxorhynchites rutilus septentrionalis]
MKPNLNGTSENYQANQNLMPTATSDYYPPAQYYQQQFPSQGTRQHQQPQVPYNLGQTANMPMMLYQYNPPKTASTNQMVPPGQLQLDQPVGGGQYFIDAACTIPVGQSGNQQPQPLQQYAPFQQQQQPQPQFQKGLKLSGQCKNPRCDRCSGGQSALASANVRR